MSDARNLRILLVDDTPSIHQDFQKILGKGAERASGAAGKQVADLKAAFFAAGAKAAPAPAAAPPAATTPKPDDPKAVSFEIDSAFQGLEAVEKVRQAMAEGRPYAMAFVDVRMPPGMDGIKTIQQLWKLDAELHAVLCTAYSDYSWEQTVAELGPSDRLLILKKPFEAIEICQLASALTEKWEVHRRERRHIEELRRAEQEARAYASSLETVNRALMTAKASAEKSTQMKTEFLFHLSDQINGRLQHILGQVELLKGTNGSAADTRLLDVIVGSSVELMTTFNETLDLTLIEAGKLTLEPGACRVAEIVREVAAAAGAAATAKRLVFKLEGASDVPETMRTDGRRLRQILVELLDNAVRFTDEGEVTLRVRLEATEDWRNPLLRCDVIDTGTGIADDMRGRIFEPFCHGDQTEAAPPRAVEAAEPRSARLGLSLCKQLAQLLGGDLVVETEPRRGSTFTLTVETGCLDGVKMVPLC